MRAVEARWPGGGAKLTLTDFNRLRWTAVALRMNAALCTRAGIADEASASVVDSGVLMQRKVASLPQGACVVLWDGLNSLNELRAARPDLALRTDLRYLYVGTFGDVAPGFPGGSAPLFPRQLPPGYRMGLGAGVTLPAWVGVAGAFRAWARPFKNAYLAPAVHKRLQRGGCLVFCGLVRPTDDVIDGFFRGAALQPLRAALQTLVGLDWTTDASATRRAVDQAFTVARTAQPATEADFAALYAVVNMLHRMATLSGLHTLKAALVVNEYGVHPHLDPYDTKAYGKNVFIDFGSTRGSDLVYPRTVDLLLQSKTFECLRFLPAATHLADFLGVTTAKQFLSTCDTHAQLLLGRLRAATAGAG